MADQQAPTESELPSPPTSMSVEARIDVLSKHMARITAQLTHLTEAIDTDPIALDLAEEPRQSDADAVSVFDPADSISQESGGKSLDEAELPHTDLYKDSEDCGPSVAEGIAKRMNSSCTKRPAKEQFSQIQKKYLRPANCDSLKSPRVNLELWDDLHDKTKPYEASFQAHQKNLIKSIIPVVYLADKVVQAKPTKKESVLLLDVYDLVVDSLTLLGNSIYDFSMKRRELLKSEVAPAYKLLCHESQPITTMLFGDELPQSIRNISQVKRMAAKSVANKRKNCEPYSQSGLSRDKRGRYNSRFEPYLNFKLYEYRKPPFRQSWNPPTRKSGSTNTKQTQ